MFVVLGADAHWLVALGDYIRSTGEVPEGVPFATAPSSDWPNPLVAAQWIFSVLDSLGRWGLPWAQLAATTVTLMLLSLGARRAGASDGAVAVVLFVVAAGSLAAFGVARLQLLSLVPFALLLLCLRSEARVPTRRIWLVPVLVALWTNLHGAVLLGVCVLGVYLIFSRLRLRAAESIAVGVLSLAALLVTPVGLRTVSYYIGVMDNQAAARAEGLWARPSVSDPFDVLMILAALLLLGATCRRRLPVWEYVVLLALGVATLMAARHGVWFLMFMAVPASLGMSARGRSGTPCPERHLKWAGLVGAVCLVVTLAVVVSRGEKVLVTDPALVDEVASIAGDRVVLAPAPLVESLAVAGVRVWASNPIDAFDRDVQNAYLDFVAGEPGMVLAVEMSDVIVVADGSDTAKALMGLAGFQSDELFDGWTVYERHPSR